MANITEGNNVSFIGSKDSSVAKGASLTPGAAYFTTDTNQIFVDGVNYGEEKIVSENTVKANQKVGYLGTSVPLNGMTAMDILRKILFTTFAPKWTDASISKLKLYYQADGEGQTEYSINIGGTQYFTPPAAGTKYYVSVKTSTTGDNYTASPATASVTIGSTNYTAHGGDPDPSHTNTTISGSGIAINTEDHNRKYLNLASYGEKTITYTLQFAEGNEKVKDSADGFTKKTANNTTTPLTSATDNSNIDSSYEIKSVQATATFKTVVYAPIYFSGTSGFTSYGVYSEPNTFAAGQASSANSYDTATGGTMTLAHKEDVCSLDTDDAHKFGTGAKALRIKFQTIANDVITAGDQPLTRTLKIPEKYLTGKTLKQFVINSSGKYEDNPVVFLEQTETETKKINGVDVIYKVFKPNPAPQTMNTIAFKIV